LKGIGVFTQWGYLPVGEMINEGGLELALERRLKIKPPSRYFDEERGRSTYGLYRDFVYELEEASPGITRLVSRAIKKGGVNSAIRLLDSVPNFGDLTTKYAYKINRGRAAISVN
jgi:hypothetical protein